MPARGCCPTPPVVLEKPKPPVRICDPGAKVVGVIKRAWRLPTPAGFGMTMRLNMRELSANLQVHLPLVAETEVTAQRHILHREAASPNVVVIWRAAAELACRGLYEGGRGSRSVESWSDRSSGNWDHAGTLGHWDSLRQVTAAANLVVEVVVRRGNLKKLSALIAQHGRELPIPREDAVTNLLMLPTPESYTCRRQPVQTDDPG